MNDRAPACYPAGMQHALKARVRNGRLVLDEPTTLPEGAEIELVVADDLDDDERAELDQSLDEALDEAHAGNTVDGPEFLARLRASR